MAKKAKETAEEIEVPEVEEMPEETSKEIEKELPEVCKEPCPEMVERIVHGHTVCGYLEDRDGRKVLKTLEGVTYDV